MCWECQSYERLVLRRGGATKLIQLFGVPADGSSVFCAFSVAAALTRPDKDEAQLTESVCGVGLGAASYCGCAG